jgi:hypothetical protein
MLLSYCNTRSSGIIVIQDFDFATLQIAKIQIFFKDGMFRKPNLPGIFYDCVTG